MVSYRVGGLCEERPVSGSTSSPVLGLKPRCPSRSLIMVFFRRVRKQLDFVLLIHSDLSAA